MPAGSTHISPRDTKFLMQEKTLPRGTYVFLPFATELWSASTIFLQKEKTILVPQHQAQCR